MRLRFQSKPIGGLAEYHGAGLDLRHGDEIELHDAALAERLQRDFPGQFVQVLVAPVQAAAVIDAPPVDRQMKRPDVSRPLHAKLKPKKR